MCSAMNGTQQEKLNLEEKMDADFNELPQADDTLEQATEEKDNKIWIILAVVILLLICCCCVVMLGGTMWLWENGDDLLDLSANGMAMSLWL